MEYPIENLLALALVVQSNVLNVPFIFYRNEEYSYVEFRVAKINDPSELDKLCNKNNYSICVDRELICVSICDERIKK